MNKTIEMDNGVSAVIYRSSELKEILTAGEDFCYLDTDSISKLLSNIPGTWKIINRAKFESISLKDSNKKEIRLNRLLTNTTKTRSNIIKFANERYYDLRIKNLLLIPRDKMDSLEEKRSLALAELKELPLQIKNDLVEQNSPSIPQEPLPVSSLEIHRSVTLELDIVDGIKLQCSPSTPEEEKIVAEAMQILKDRATIVQR